MFNRLATFRERRGLSQTRLAEALDVSHQTIVAIEKGKYDPSLPLAKAIAEFFKVAVEDVFPVPDTDVVATRATFVMTDIVGSTALVSRLGEAYVDVVRRHRELLIDAFTSNGGRVVDDTGDACFAVFNDAGQAVLATLAAQRAVGAEQWPENADVRIRAGIHTGDAFAVGNRFVGIAVHETARVCAAAETGQILVSEPTASAGAGDVGRLEEKGERELHGVGTRRLYLVGKQ